MQPSAFWHYANLHSAILLCVIGIIIFPILAFPILPLGPLLLNDCVHSHHHSHHHHIFIYMYVLSRGGEACERAGNGTRGRMENSRMGNILIYPALRCSSEFIIIILPNASLNEQVQCLNNGVDLCLVVEDHAHHPQHHTEADCAFHRPILLLSDQIVIR